MSRWFDRMFGASDSDVTIDPSAREDPVHLRIRDVTKSYGDHLVLKGCSFDVIRGKTNVIIGPSGSGKTVLMRQIIRLEKPDEGQILVNGVTSRSSSGWPSSESDRGWAWSSRCPRSSIR